MKNKKILISKLNTNIYGLLDLKPEIEKIKDLKVYLGYTTKNKYVIIHYEK